MTRLALISAFLIFISVAPATADFDDPIPNSLKDLSPLQKTFILGKHQLPPTITKSGKTEKLFFWDNPAGWAERVQGKLADPGNPVPVAIFLHGCSGITYANRDLFQLLLGEDWAVFAPDSFARPGRERLCYTNTEMDRLERVKEARYALARLSAMTWVDRTRIVLVGHSEGGHATNLWSYGGIAAIISTGGNCRTTNDMMYASNDIPVLNLVGETDTREHPPCHVDGRGKGSKGLVVPNIGHQVYESDLAQQEIRQFLKTCCGPK